MDHLFESLLLELSDVLLVALDSAGALAEWRPAAEHILGFAKHEWVGQPFRMIFTPEDRAAGIPEQEIETARHSGRAAATRWYQHKDGRRVCLESALVAHYDPSGQVVVFANVMRDITARRAVAEELSRSAARHALVVRLLDGQRRTSDPEAMMRSAVEGVGRYLNVDRVGFFEVRDDQLHFTVGWTAGHLPLLTGVFPATGIGARYVVEVRAGRALGISDTRTDPLTADSLFGEIGTVSLIGAPIIRQGLWHAGLYVNHSEPRVWTEEEIELVRQIGEQTWEAIERARSQLALRKSEEEFRTLSATIPQLIWTATPDGDVDYLSEQWEDHIGLPRDQLYQGVWEQVVHPEDLPNTLRDWTRCIRSGEPLRIRHRFRQRGAGWRWQLTRAIPVRNEDYRITRWVGTCTDIQSEMDAEEALRTSEERLSFALEAGGGVGAWDWDIVADRLYCNTQFARLFSVDAERAAAGASINEFIGGLHPDDRPRITAMMQKALETGGHFAEEYRLLQEDGSVRWVYARGRCHLGANGRAVRFPGVVFDITDRKRAEQQLQEQWHAFDTALSNTPDFTYTFDLQGRFTYVNRALLSLLQIPLSMAVGKNFFDLGYPPELAARLQRQIQTVVDTRQTLRDETPFTGPTGETRHYEYIFVPVLGATAEVEAVAGSTRDITERQQAEESERERQEQLRESARLESLGVMAGGIAHDFNNLLVGILGNASLLAEIAQESDRPIAADIVLAAERAAELTKQMLAYSGGGRFVTEVFDLNKLIQDNLTLLRASIARNVSVQLDFASGPCVVEADRAQIQQVIMNLLINASEAIGASPGVILVRTATSERAAPRISDHLHSEVLPGSYVQVEISDNGSGISTETLKRIFDPFFTTKFTGRGLGLAAVLGIVKGHGGDIEVASVPGQGTTFRILLPASDHLEGPKPLTDLPSRSGLNEFCVLVVDDEDIVVRTASAALASRGLQVLTAANGSQALQVLREHTEVSLVILDLTMPVMTGEQAIPLIKALDPRLPIILSSGFSEAEISRRFASAGIAGVLQKPYTLGGLVAKVTHVLLDR